MTKKSEYNQQGQTVKGHQINAGGNVKVEHLGDKITYQGLTVTQVAALMLELAHKDQPEVWNGRYPYLGLTAFQESDAQFFFGRESLVDDLLERVQTSRFITIAGPSGSGKSSVARAGLLHALREGRLEKSDSWLLATMQPKGNPIGQLAQAMERVTKSTQVGNAIRTEGASNPALLQRQIEMHLSDDPRQRCVLLVDQFEELFTQTKDDAERVAFIDLLTTAAQADGGRIIILLSLRSDFISHCTRYPNLRSLMSQQFQLVGAMDPPDLAKAITLPALEVGAKIDPELVSRIMADMKGEPGALPLMSFALRDLFEAEKSAKGEPMDLLLPEYVERGGIESALERHANKVFDNFTDEQKGLARGVFSKLIEVGQGRADTRRTASFSELIPAGTGQEAVEAVVSALANGRLITTSGKKVGKDEEDASTVTIAHEKLIDAWPWLRQLVDENRNMIILQNQISTDAQTWTKEKDAGFLYRGGRLIQVEGQLKASTPDLNELSQTFIQASLDERQKEIDEKEAQRRRTIKILAGAFGVSLIFAVVAILFFLRSNDNAQIANENLVTATAALIAAETANADAVLQRNEALIAGTAEAQALATSIAESTRAFYSEGTAQAEAATAEYNANVAATREQEAIVAGNQALAQSLTANSRALLSDRNITNQELAQARLLAMEGDQLNQEVGRPQDQTLSQGLLYALATEKPDTYQPLTTLIEHTDTVWSVAWNGDGGRLASASDDDTVIIWDTESWQPVTTLTEHTDNVQSVAWNGDGSLLASASSDNTIIIWDTKSWQPVTTLTEHTNRVVGVAWNNDGSRLASASADDIVIIWDAESWQPVVRLTEHTDTVVSVAWNGDGSHLASASVDGTVIIWDTDSWQPLATLITPTEYTGIVRSVAWNKDGSRLASATNATVVIWNTDSWQSLATLEHTGIVGSVAWNGDGSRLASASWDNTVIIWDTDSWQPLTTLTEHRGLVRDVAWNMDDNRLASSDRTVIIWDTEGWQPLLTLTEHASAVSGVAWNGDGSRLASASNDDTVIIWQADENQPNKWQPVTTLTEHTDNVQGVVWNEDGSRLASASSDDTVIIWDTESWQPVTILAEHTAGVSSVAWNGDGSRLASASYDNTVIIWDTESWQPVTTLTEHTDNVWSVAWNGDGNHLASASVDGTVIIWQADENQPESWQPVATLTENPGRVWSVAWTGDGSRLASASSDGTVIIWDTESWQPMITLAEQKFNVWSVAWNGDGSRLASASSDNTVIIWDTASWQPMTTLTGRRGDVNSVAWERDGNRLASASFNSTIIIRKFPDFSALNCSLVGRNLSLVEWEQFLPGVAYRRTCVQWPSGAGAPADAPLWGE